MDGNRAGYVYGVTLFEGEKQTLAFTPNRIAGHYYLHNEELTGKIKDLFEAGPIPLMSPNARGPNHEKLDGRGRCRGDLGASSGCSASGSWNVKKDTDAVLTAVRYR